MRLSESKKEALEAVLKLDFGDDPSMGGEGTCRLCQTEDHEGRICPEIRSMQFHRDGSVKSIRLKGGGSERFKNVRLD